jgi:hypothetical protein
MNQELIDLLRGALPPAEAEALRARIAADAELRRETAELASLLALLRRGGEIEPSAALRDAVLRAAARSVRLRRLRAIADGLAALPGLAAYRFRRSRAFRFAFVSAIAHLVLLAVLYHVVGRRPADEIDVASTRLEPPALPSVAPAPVPVPERRFILVLRQRALPHGPRLASLGVPGQAEAIARGIEALASAQLPDGSFGTLERTGAAALALLAEGVSSRGSDARAASLARAVHHLERAAQEGNSCGFAVAALVEDYALSWESLLEEERSIRVAAILRGLRRLDASEAACEARALVQLCGIARDAGELGAAAALLGGPREHLLRSEPTRLAVTAAMARGPSRLDPQQLRAWARPLFERALARVADDPASPEALLVLQSPYRL